jgi:dolichol-phosphate mannosyltransferase
VSGGRWRLRGIAATMSPTAALGAGESTVRVLVIVPTYNERENICPLVRALLDVEGAIEVLIVDDNSPDGTGLLADTLARGIARVHVLHRAGKLGLGTAYVAGFKFALERRYDLIVEMDADFSHRPSDLPALLDAARTADVVIGSRNIPGGRAEHWSPLRYLISRCGSFYARAMLRMPVRDVTSGFKCFRRAVLASIDLDAVRSNGYAFQVEMNYLCFRAGYRIAEVPIVFPDRTAGRSKMSRSIVIEAATMVWGLRRDPPRVRPAHAAATSYMGTALSHAVPMAVESPIEPKGHDLADSIPQMALAAAADLETGRD